MDLNEFLIKEDIKKKYILDTSVIIKWYSSDNEDNVNNAGLFYKQVRDNQIIIISLDLMVYELLNFFNFKLCLPENKINDILSEIYDIVFVINSNKSLLEEAYKIAKIIKNSIYDSSYIALSLKLHFPLFTADKKLFSIAKEHGYNVFMISDYQQFF
jgi:predicted nucleic acid-binding protein